MLFRSRALVSKDATIREIHHRVKNNLQAVSALLRLQARRVDDPNASAAIEEAVRRVASIAVVHETLSTNHKDSVTFDDVVSKIASNAIELSPRSKEVEIIRSGEFGEISSIVATPLALVITELIHNALEHGLAIEGSKVEITAHRSGRTMRVLIADDGIGLPVDFNLEKKTSLGLQIVRTLTSHELAGTIEFSRLKKGTEIELRFELP